MEYDLELEKCILAKDIQPYLLVPEIAILEYLPEHLRKRFVCALRLMLSQTEGSIVWEEVSKESAVSSSHFHRQFTELFNETPGQYLSRLKLQTAIRLLTSGRNWSVTEVAHYCDFSSSQALAKALKSKLGLTAKQIRKIYGESTPDEWATFTYKLAHPDSEVSLENKLAKLIPTELKWYSQRSMKKITLPLKDWNEAIEVYGEKSIQLMGSTPISQLDRDWDMIDNHIGDRLADAQTHDLTIPAGYYLCSEVYVVSDSGYIAALEFLFDIAIQRKLQVDKDASLIEIIRHIDHTFTDGVWFSFQIPILEVI